MLGVGSKSGRRKGRQEGEARRCACRSYQKQHRRYSGLNVEESAAWIVKCKYPTPLSGHSLIKTEKPHPRSGSTTIVTSTLSTCILSTCIYPVCPRNAPFCPFLLNTQQLFLRSNLYNKSTISPTFNHTTQEAPETKVYKRKYTKEHQPPPAPGPGPLRHPVSICARRHPKPASRYRYTRSQTPNPIRTRFISHTS